jgi:hypothetical protein
MLEIVSADGPVAAFQARGTLSVEDYDMLTGELERQLREHEQIAIFADVTRLDGLSFDAWVQDLRYSLSKLGEIKRFARVALVTDRAWLGAWTHLAWTLVPKAEVRRFAAHERDGALAWAGELPAQPAHRGLRWIGTNRPDTYAFAWSGTITDQDVDAVVKRLEAGFAAHERVRVLARVDRLGGIRPHALFQSSVLRLKALGFSKIERYALVGGPRWLARYANVLRELTGIAVRHYSSDQESEAWAWLEAQPVEPSLPATPDDHSAHA